MADLGLEPLDEFVDGVFADDDHPGGLWPAHASPPLGDEVHDDDDAPPHHYWDSAAQDEDEDSTCNLQEQDAAAALGRQHNTHLHEQQQMTLAQGSFIPCSSNLEGGAVRSSSSTVV